MSYDDLPVELWNLLDGVCNDTLDERQAAELESHLLSDTRACELYIDFLALDAELQWLSSSQQEGEAILEKIIETDAPYVAAPVVNIHDDAVSGAGDYFSQGVLYSYMIGGVLTGLLLLVAALIPASSTVQTAKKASPPVRSIAGIKAERETIGQITGMLDCQGTMARGEGKETSKSPILSPQSLVALGDKFVLSSGLLEITYDTGAKVILQGPVTYEADSRDGGFLGIGKLTARLEKRGEGREERGEPVASGQWPVVSKEGTEVANHKSPVPALTLALSQRERGPNSNPQSLIPNPLLLPTSRPQSPAPVFAVRTPTATITDLGTEFGVEVDKKGTTTSHVFRGVVQVQAMTPRGEPEGKALVLRENQSARVENVQGNLQLAKAPTVEPKKFIRGIPLRAIKYLDLVDVVAGGNGFSNRRNAGIDPTNGQFRVSPPPNNGYHMTGDGKYHLVQGSPFIDGVFIPAGKRDSVQLDSAGHVFNDFPETDNQTSGYVWAGGVIPAEPPLFFLPAILDGVDYSAKGHGVLGMHANKGITFDLAAIRRLNPGYRPTKFLATAGNTADSLVGIWVFVDGQKRFQRREFNQYLGAAPISITLGEKDRFLTLVATDNGSGFGAAWVTFGDPRLELKPIPSSND